MELSIISASIIVTQVLSFPKKNRATLINIAHFKTPKKAPKNLLKSPKEALLTTLVKARANNEIEYKIMKNIIKIRPYFDS